MAGLALVACAGEPLYPIASPPAAMTFQAPVDAVWQATLESLGVIPPVSVDRARGRIVTGTYNFALPVQAGGHHGSVTMQALLVSMEILVRPTGEGTTTVQARTTIHDALAYGIWPGAGGPNSPEGDLFARIASRLAGR